MFKIFISFCIFRFWDWLRINNLKLLDFHSISSVTDAFGIEIRYKFIRIFNIAATHHPPSSISENPFNQSPIRSNTVASTKHLKKKKKRTSSKTYEHATHLHLPRLLPGNTQHRPLRIVNGVSVLPTVFFSPLEWKTSLADSFVSVTSPLWPIFSQLIHAASVTNPFCVASTRYREVSSRRGRHHQKERNLRLPMSANWSWLAGPFHLSPASYWLVFLGLVATGSYGHVPTELSNLSAVQFHANHVGVLLLLPSVIS